MKRSSTIMVYLGIWPGSNSQVTCWPLGDVVSRQHGQGALYTNYYS